VPHYPIHPAAEALRLQAGITEGHARQILIDASKRNPALLMFGYHADYAILGIWLALHHEDMDWLDEDEINNRVDSCLATMYAGVI
jgi:hypothetical protein